MEILSNFTNYEIIYFVILIIFTLFFGFKGILQSLGFTLKIVGSITLPFMTYKAVLASLSNYFSSNAFLNSLIMQYPLISEIVVFVIIFLLSYFIFGIFEKLLKINFVKNFTIKIIDFIFGCIYGLFLFSILFYFIFNLTLKNYFNESTMHKIMIYNIDLYDSLRLYEDDSKQESETIQFEEQNEIY